MSTLTFEGRGLTYELRNQNVRRPFFTLCHFNSFIPDIYIAPLQETYSEALSVQLRSKRNVLRSLQKEDTLFRGSKHSVRGSSFQVEGPITEKARHCISAEQARGIKSSPRAEEQRALQCLKNQSIKRDIEKERGREREKLRQREDRETEHVGNETRSLIWLTQIIIGC